MSKFTFFPVNIDKKFAFLLGSLGALAAAYGIYKLMQRLSQPDEYFTTLKWQVRGWNP